MRLAACCGAAVAAAGGLVPSPVGEGPLYHPPAHDPRTVSTACRPAPLRSRARVHVELFADRRVVIVPAGIGLGRPQLRLGRVVSAVCRARLWTTDPSGVVRYEAPATLGELFAVWRQPLGPARLASFRGSVAVYVNGVRFRGDPRRVGLRDRDEIVLEVGGFVPPHRSYRFPP